MKPKIAVINDSKTQLTFCIKNLDESKYEVKGFTSPTDFLEEIQIGYQPNLVITDLYMPEVDGWRLCRLLRSAEFSKLNSTPIILFSSTFAGADVEEITKETGANLFLPFPFNKKTLNKAVSELLKGKRAYKKPLVLIIDDDPEVCNLLELAFSENQYRVKTASTVSEAEVFLQKRTPDLMIIDYHLPDGKAVEILKTLKDNQTRTAVIAITGDPSPELAIELMQNGADAYIQKPFDINYVLEVASRIRREYSLLRVEKLLEERSRQLRERNLLLRETTERYEKIITNSPEGYLLLSSNLEISTVNEAFLKLFNLKYEDIVGEKVKKLQKKFKDNPLFSRLLGFIASIGDMPMRMTREIIFNRNAYEVTFIPIEENNNEILCMVNDVSEKHRLEKAKNALLKIARDANTTEDLYTLFQHIHQHLSEIIDTTNFYISLYDHERDLLTFPYFVDEKDGLSQDPIPLGNGVTSLVFKTNHSLLLKDYTPESIKKQFNVEIIGSLSKCWLGVPLRIKSNVIGVIAVQSYTDSNLYSHRDIELLEFCSEQIAAVINRKRTESVLRESERVHRTIVHNSPAAIFLLDDKLRFLFVNRQFTRITGYPEHEIIDRELFSIFSPEDSLSIKKFYSTRDKKEKTSRFVIHGTTADGEEKVYDLRLTLFQEENNEKKTLGQLLDITELNRIEEELKKREREYRVTFENSGAGICVLGPDLKILRVNKILSLMMELEPEEIIGTRVWRRLLKKEDVKKLLAIVRKFKSGDESYYPISLQMRIRTFSGKERDLFLTLSFIKEEQLTVVSVIDFTEQKTMERALQEQKERLSVTLRSIGDGVITTNISGQIEMVNRGAEEILGINGEDWIGRLLIELFKVQNARTKEPFEFPINSVLSGTSLQERFDNIILLTHDKREINISALCNPIKDRRSEIIGSVVVFRDITSELKTLEEMNQLEKLQSIGLLAGGIAHDFNNILAAILGNISLARLESEENEFIESILRDAERECLRAKGLTHQLLTFAKGGAPIKELTSLRELIKDSVSFNLRGSKVRYKLKIPANLYAVDIDTSQISQVIGNLVLNAQQAMPLGGTLIVQAENITILPDEKIGPLPPGKYVKVDIIDEGTGISPENLKRIFDPYFTTKQKGSGLGLATCYSIIKNHGGFITAESTLGKGSTFTFYLPAAGEPIEKKSRKEELEVSGSGKILVMDDDVSIQNAVKRLLGKIGYQVDIASDGEKAVALYKTAKESGKAYDLVIMDLTIPGGMGGVDAIKLLREYDPHVKAIVFSGYSNDPVMANYKKYGFDGVVTKPFSIQEIVNVIQKVLAGNGHKKKNRDRKALKNT